VAQRRPVQVTRHGADVVDQYAWLRNRDDASVISYLEAENAFAEEFLAPTAKLRDRVYGEMLGRIKETDLSVPIPLRGFEYYSRTEQGLQYPVHCRKPLADGAPEEILVDLNLLAQGKSFMSLGSMTVSDDSRLLAYSTDETGYRQYTLVVKAIATSQHDALREERVTSVAWAADNTTLFFTTEDTTTKRSNQLWRVRLGESPLLVIEEPDEAFSLSVHRTRSRDWLVLSSASHTTAECSVLPADQPTAAWRTVRPRVNGVEYDLDHQGEWFLVRINDAGRNFRLARCRTDDVTATLDEVIGHRADTMLEGVDAFATFMVLTEREGGIPQLSVREIGNATHRMSFPEPVYEAYLHSNPEWQVDTVRVAYQSLVTPPSVFRYDVSSRERTLLKQQEVVGGYDSSRFVSERLEATAPDGTRIPISIVRRADVAVNGSAAALLSGYGAYGYPYPVAFSSNRLSLLERGMVVAIAHVRGGGELGKQWHDGGRMESKPNSFTDFVACAEHLQSRGFVASARLAIEGGSAGGLLMGAVVNLRPDLFAAVLSQVPFVDVINTMSDPTLPLTVGEYEEWGNPDIAEQYRWMASYCPYSNLRPGPYPAMLVRTALNDSQVMYWEPAKYVARIRQLRTNDAPLLFLTNMGAGHGGASGRYDRLREIAVDYAFMLGVLGVEPGAISKP